MPLILDDDSPDLDIDQLTFRERLRTGRVVPILSNRVIFDRVLNGYDSFLSSFAGYVKYPRDLGQPRSQVELVKYHKHRPRDKPLGDQALKFEYLNYVKNQFYRKARADGVDQEVLDEVVEEMEDLSVSEFAGRLGYPRFDDQHDPLLMMAHLPFKTILTTSPYTFIEDALRRAHKEPRTEVCRWTNELQDSISLDPPR